MKIFAKNKRAKFDYEFLDKYTSGISLLGTEVKSIKKGDVDLSGSYIVIDNDNNVQWINGNIARYIFQTQGSHDKKRTRQLLLNKKEIKKLKIEIQQKKLTLIPYIIYADYKGRIKLEFYVSRGKNTRDKREEIKSRDLKRETKINH